MPHSIDIVRVVRLTRQAADALERGNSNDYVQLLREALSEHQAWIYQRPHNALYLSTEEQSHDANDAARP